MSLQPRHSQSRDRGFTIVELAIVVSIIGIFASTAGVRYVHFLERARTAVAIVELRGIAVELDLFGEDGGSFPESLAEIGISTLDPWGRPYLYLKIQGDLPPGLTSTPRALPHVAAPPVGAGGGGGGPPAIALARKDKFLVPINSDYDLYSVGPDGETMATLNSPKSRDDIIRAADGGFYGLAEKF